MIEISLISDAFMLTTNARSEVQLSASDIKGGCRQTVGVLCLKQDKIYWRYIDEHGKVVVKDLYVRPK